MISVITKRADFLRANSGLRNARAGFVLLTRPNDGQGIRFGITVTKKIGNAVVRNRMKRRFRALLRELLPELGLAGADHVLIGREAVEPAALMALVRPNVVGNHFAKNAIEKPFDIKVDALDSKVDTVDRVDRTRPPRKRYREITDVDQRR